MSFDWTFLVVQCVQQFCSGAEIWSCLMFLEWNFRAKNRFFKIAHKTSPKGKPERQFWKSILWSIFWSKISLQKPQKWPNWGSRTKIFVRNVGKSLRSQTLHLVVMIFIKGWFGVAVRGILSRVFIKLVCLNLKWSIRGDYSQLSRYVKEFNQNKKVACW